MGLSIKQIEACRRLSRGEKDKDIYPVLEISESSFYKWKKQPAFNKCLEIFTQAELERAAALARSEEHTSELQSPVPISYAVFCLKKKKKKRKKEKKKKKKNVETHTRKRTGKLTDELRGVHRTI